MGGFDVTDLPLTDSDLGGRSLATMHATRHTAKPLCELETHFLHWSVAWEGLGRPKGSKPSPTTLAQRGQSLSTTPPHPTNAATQTPYGPVYGLYPPSHSHLIADQ